MAEKREGGDLRVAVYIDVSGNVRRSGVDRIGEIEYNLREAWGEEEWADDS